MRGMVAFFLGVGFELANEALFPREKQWVVLGVVVVVCLIAIVGLERKARRNQREPKMSLPLFRAPWPKRMAGAIRSGSPAVHAVLAIVFFLLVVLYIWLYQGPR